MTHVITNEPANVAPAEPVARSPLVVHAVLLFVQLVFGANYVVAKVAFNEVSPSALVVIRTWGTAIILFGMSALVGAIRGANPKPRLTARDYGELILYSALGASINQLCFLEGLARSTATNAGIMLVSIPLLTLAFAVLLRRERATATGIAGIVIGLAGALILILPRGVDISARAAVGNVLLLTGGVSYSLYLVLTRGILTRHDPIRVVSWIFLFAGITVLPVGFSDLRASLATGISPGAWASIAYVVVGATVLPYVLINWALVRIKSSIVAVYVLIQPIVAGVLGRVVLHEELAAHAAVAGALIVTGVFVSSVRRAA